jgi:hypothetical protein
MNFKWTLLHWFFATVDALNKSNYVKVKFGSVIFSKPYVMVLMPWPSHVVMLLLDGCISVTFDAMVNLRHICQTLAFD